MAEIASPNVANYGVLKGELFWTPLSGNRRSLGNAPQFSIDLGVDVLDHFSSRTGVKTKDATVTLQKTCTVNITLDELTLKNFAIALLGSSPSDTDDVTATTEGHNLTGFDIGSVSQVNGKLELVGSNDVGPQYLVLLPSVNLKPNGAIEFISDSKWTEMQITGDVLYVNGSFGRFDLQA